MNATAPLTIIHPDGVYFGLPEDDYQADPALGYSALKALLVSPPRWWGKSSFATAFRAGLDIEPTDDDTKAKLFGSAVHTVTLDGKKAFDQLYYVEPKKPEGYLETKDHLMEAFDKALAAGLIPSDLGVVRPVKSATKTEWLKACRQASIGPLLDDWLAEQKLLAAGRTQINKGWGTTLLLIDKMLDAPRADLGGKSQRQMFLTGGQPEVSIFWTDERGIRLKARIDYLRIAASSDVKTYAARDDQECIHAFCNSVANYAYTMQVAHYQDARAQIGELLMAGRVYLCTSEADRAPEGGGEPGTGTIITQARSDFAIMEWLRKVAAEENPKWLWIAIQTMGFPETDVLPFEGAMLDSSARVQIAQAKDQFVEYRDKFGMETPWVSDRGVIVLGDLEFDAMGLSRRMMSKGELAWTT